MRAGLLLLALGLARCSGSVGAEPNATGTPSGPTADPAVVLLRLTAHQYAQSIEDVFGVPPDGDPPADQTAGGFSSFSGATVNDADINTYHRVAAATARRILASPPPPLVDCASDRACRIQWLEATAQRLWADSFSPTDFAAAKDLLMPGNEDPDAETEAMLTFLLSAPAFLYLPVRTTAAGPGELAARLAAARRLTLVFWQSVPDADLIRALQDGLGGPALADYVLADPRHLRGLLRFHEELLELDQHASAAKDPARYPEYDADTAAAMRTEFGNFIHAVFADQNASLTGLLTHRFAYPEDETRFLYDGATSPSVPFTGDDPRGGLLTQPAFLTTHANAQTGSVVQRGLVVRTRLLCESIPPPPDGVTMDALANRTETEPCATCHRLIDPVGDSFAMFDAIGAPTEEGAAGLLRETDVDGPIDGPQTLAARLSDSEQVARCYAKQWLRFALGRDTSDGDTPFLGELQDEFVASSGRIRPLLRRIAVHPIFLNPAVAEPLACEAL